MSDKLVPPFDLVRELRSRWSVADEAATLIENQHRRIKALEAELEQIEALEAEAEQWAKDFAEADKRIEALEAEVAEKHQQYVDANAARIDAEAMADRLAGAAARATAIKKQNTRLTRMLNKAIREREK